MQASVSVLEYLQKTGADMNINIEDIFAERIEVKIFSAKKTGGTKDVR